MKLALLYVFSSERWRNSEVLTCADTLRWLGWETAEQAIRHLDGDMAGLSLGAVILSRDGLHALCLLQW